MANGEDCSEGGGDSASRRLSFMKMVGLGKKKEAGPAAGAEPQHIQEPEPPEAPQEEKPREPLSGESGGRRGTGGHTDTGSKLCVCRFQPAQA